MPSHPFDFQLQANFFSTPELVAVFDEQRRISRWLQIEAALAQAQGELGIIPAEAAQEIKSKAKLEFLDLARLQEGYQQSRNSIMPVVKELRRTCRDNCGEYVHYGATTQDILDTAQVLELEEALQIIFRDLRALEKLLIGLCRKHQKTAMIARTHGQQAMPTTFGLKAAVWTEELRRHIERLKSIYPRAMTGQLSGAVGTMAALGLKAREVADRTMALLNLKATTLSWHTSRDNMAEIASFFAILAGTLEKIANEIYYLGKTETGELAEAPPGSLMSSTMPHKKNPVFCQRVAVLARHIRSLAGCIVDSMPHEHERDPRLLWTEWLAMPQISIYTGTAVNYLIKIIDGLAVNEQAMKKNLYLQQNMVLSEWLLFKLASSIGKMKAQEKLHALLLKATGENRSLKDILAEDEEISRLLTPDDFASLDHPEQYIGLAFELVDDALAEITAQRQNDPKVLSQ